MSQKRTDLGHFGELCLVCNSLMNYAHGKCISARDEGKNLVFGFLVLVCYCERRVPFVVQT